MQALRQAESAKKNQAAPAPEVEAPPAPVRLDQKRAELTLETREPSLLDLAEAAEPPRSAPEPVIEAADPVDYFSSESPPARAPFIAVYATPPVQAEAPEEVRVAAEPPPPPPEPPAPPVRAGNPRSSPEQQMAAERAAQKIAEARAAASTVFAAKQRVRRRRPLIIAGLGLLALCAGGIYLYTQLTLTAPPPAAMAVPPVADVGTPGVATPGVATPGVATTEGATTEVAATAATASEVVATPEAAPTDAATAPVAAVAAPVAAVAAPVSAAAASPAPRVRKITLAPTAMAAAAPAPRPRAAASGAAPIQFSRVDATREVNPALVSAYQAFNRGDLAAARSGYQRVLQQDADNRDALLGMAAIAVNRGLPAEAGAFYARLLELDPLDAEAASGLAGIERNDPAQAESRLKQVLAGSPNSAAAYYALGNVYAQQQRWAEAQQAYFQAVGAAPANADYHFNLAVGLDKLGQRQLALDTYLRAAQLAERGGFNIDQAAVQTRVRQLREQLAAATR